MLSRKLNHSQLLAMDGFTASHPLEIELAYATNHNFMGVAIYRPQARLWLYEDVARTVLLASQLGHERYGYRMRLYDGLRTVDAQKAMQKTAVVQANPQWLEKETRLLSPPGKGGHPRGMAVDLTLLGQDGVPLEMGTEFDELSPEGSGPAFNKAHRDYQPLDQVAVKNRALLEEVIRDAANALDVPLMPLASEWWDFRLPKELYETYAPLEDADLPTEMRMVAS